MSRPIKPRKLSKKEKEIVRRNYKVRNRKFGDELKKYPQYKNVTFYIPPLTGAYVPILNPKEWLQTSTTLYVPLSHAPRNDLPASHSDVVYRYNERLEKQLQEGQEKDTKREVRVKEHDRAAVEHQKRREQLAQQLRHWGNKKD